VIFRYVRALLTEVPRLARLVQRETADSFDLSNKVSIEVGTASFRTTRGYAICAALLDEAAFWRTDDAAEPDHEIIAAIRPGMAQFPNATLLVGSSPYARRGALWDAFHRWYGKCHAPLVWQAATRTMNPTVPQRIVDEAMERDPASAAASYWLAAAAWGKSDLLAAWDAALAAWVRAGLTLAQNADLRGDIDRLMLRGIIPDRARATAQPADVLRAEWDRFKERWSR